MKKIIVSLFVLVFCFGININAQTILSNASLSKKTELKTTKEPEFTCKKLSNGLIRCDNNINYRYYKYGNGRLHSETFYRDDCLSTYYYDTSVTKKNPYLKSIVHYHYYANGKLEYKQSVNLQKKSYTYNSEKFLDGIKGFTKYTTFRQLSYSKTGEKINYSVWKRNVKLIDYKKTYYKYFENGKIKEKGIIMTNNNKKIYSKYYRVNYSNGKMKIRDFSKYTVSGKYKATYLITYRKDGTKANYKRGYFKNGKVSEIIEYAYNKRGLLRSNHYGNAYKYIHIIDKKGYVMEVLRGKYNKKGKLSKYQIVDNRDLAY